MSRQCRLLQPIHQQLQLDEAQLILSTATSFFYKLQKIVSCKGEIIGHEVLLDFKKAKKYVPEGLVQYKKAINDGTALDHLLSRFLNQELSIFDTKVFINVERMNLCNKILLRKINFVAKNIFRSNNVELVVEITERNPCGFCINIMDGLAYMKRNGILLAADDFDIYGDDFRGKEVGMGLYDFIKVIMPKSTIEATIFNHFVSERRGEVILEMVEDHHQLGKWNLAPVYGYQGFAYS